MSQSFDDFFKLWNSKFQVCFYKNKSDVLMHLPKFSSMLCSAFIKWKIIIFYIYCEVNLFWIEIETISEFLLKFVIWCSIFRTIHWQRWVKHWMILFELDAINLIKCANIWISQFCIFWLIKGKSNRFLSN